MASEEMITITRSEYQKFLAQQSEIDWLKHQLAQLQKMLFGSKSERNIAPDPLHGSLFDLPSGVIPEKQVEEISCTRIKPENQDKKHPFRVQISSHLPRKVEVIEPAHLPEGAKKTGESETEIIEYTPASI